MKNRIAVFLACGIAFSSCEKDEIFQNSRSKEKIVRNDLSENLRDSLDNKELGLKRSLSSDPHSFVLPVDCPDYGFFQGISGMALSELQQAYEAGVIACPNEILPAQPSRTVAQILSEFDACVAVPSDWRDKIIEGFKYVVGTVTYHAWALGGPQECSQMSTEDLITACEQNAINTWCGETAEIYSRFSERQGYESFVYCVNYPATQFDPSLGHSFTGVIGPDGEYYWVDPTFKDYLQDNLTGAPLSIQDAFAFAQDNQSERIGFSSRLVPGLVLSPTATLITVGVAYQFTNETVVREAPSPDGMRYRIEGAATRVEYFAKEERVQEFALFLEAWRPQLEASYPQYDWSSWHGQPDELWKLIFFIPRIFGSPNSEAIYQEIVTARGF
jgi:hypothetical protein